MFSFMKKETGPVDLEFVWMGLDKKYRKVEGEVTAKDLITAKALARSQNPGYVINKVKKKSPAMFSFGNKIKPADIAIFTRQMATMMKAGVPLVQSFDIVNQSVKNEKMKKMIRKIRDDVSSGHSLADSLRSHPDYFDDLFCSLIAAGEDSGNLEVMLDRVATYKEKTEALKKKIKKAMTYPAAVVAVAIVVTGILLVKVVPSFAETFAGFGAELPPFTLLVMGISEWMQANWYILIGMGFGAFYAFGQAKKRSKLFSDWVEALSLKLPIVGNILHDSVIARFSRTLSTTYASGVPLTDSLDSTKGAVGNSVFRKAVEQIKEDVVGGDSLTYSVKSSKKFPIMLVQMTSIGEESGALDEMLGKVADHYEMEVDNAVDSLSSLMEPMIMAVLGVLVGALMVAMYLPIFQLGSVI